MIQLTSIGKKCVNVTVVSYLAHESGLSWVDVIMKINMLFVLSPSATASPSAVWPVFKLVPWGITKVYNSRKWIMQSQTSWCNSCFNFIRKVPIVDPKKTEKPLIEIQYRRTSYKDHTQVVSQVIRPRANWLPAPEKKGWWDNEANTGRSFVFMSKPVRSKSRLTRITALSRKKELWTPHFRDIHLLTLASSNSVLLSTSFVFKCDSSPRKGQQRR